MDKVLRSPRTDELLLKNTLIKLKIVLVCVKNKSANIEPTVNGVLYDLYMYVCMCTVCVCVCVRVYIPSRSGGIDYGYGVEVCIYIYIYIYIEREREREGKRW